MPIIEELDNFIHERGIVMNKKWIIGMVIMMVYYTIGGVVMAKTGLGSWVFSKSIYGLFRICNYTTFMCIYWYTTIIGWLVVAVMTISEGVAR